jgi:hypothetical protein
MLQPLTALTENEVLEYTGIELSKVLTDDAKIYLRRVTFLIENYIRQHVLLGDKVITENEEIVKTAICMQIEYQKINGELQSFSLVDITKLQVGDKTQLRQWVISDEVINLLTSRGLLYRGLR